MSASPAPSNPASQTDSGSSKKKQNQNDSTITIPVVAPVENTANGSSESLDEGFFRDLNKCVYYCFSFFVLSQRLQFEMANRSLALRNLRNTLKKLVNLTVSYSQ